MGPFVCISDNLLLLPQVPVVTEGAANNGDSLAGAGPQVLVATTEGATNNANNEGKLVAADQVAAQSSEPEVTTARPRPRRHSFGLDELEYYVHCTASLYQQAALTTNELFSEGPVY